MDKTEEFIECAEEELENAICKFDKPKRFKKRIASRFFHEIVRVRAAGERRNGLKQVRAYEEKIQPNGFSLEELNKEYLENPNAYTQKYTQCKPPTNLGFNTLNKGYNARITRNNLKNVEYEMQDLGLSYVLTKNKEKISFFDVGVGRSLENMVTNLDTLKIPYDGTVVELNKKSLDEFKKRYDGHLVYKNATLADPNFKWEKQHDIGSMHSVLYLNPTVLRPIVLNNFVNGLKPGGVGVLTTLLDGWHTHSGCIITTNTEEDALAGSSEIGPRLDGLRELMPWSLFNQKTIVYKAPNITDLSNSLGQYGCKIRKELAWPNNEHYPWQFYGGVIIEKK